MRTMHFLWAVLLAIAVVSVAALANPSGHSTAKAPAAMGSRARAAAPAPDMDPGDKGDDRDDMERMDGPDAWDGLGMGPAGLRMDGRRLGPRAGLGMRLHARGTRRQELEERLGVTADQHERIQSILDRQLRNGIEQRAKLQIAALDLRAMMLAEHTDRPGIESKIDEIAQLRAEQTKARLGALLELRGVLTPEQQKKLHSLRGGSAGRKI